MTLRYHDNVWISTFQNETSRRWVSVRKIGNITSKMEVITANVEVNWYIGDVIDDETFVMLIKRPWWHLLSPTANSVNKNSRQQHFLSSISTSFYWVHEDDVWNYYLQSMSIICLFIYLLWCYVTMCYVIIYYVIEMYKYDFLKNHFWRFIRLT